MSWRNTMTRTPLVGGSDVQGNLRRILLVTSRAWGLAITQPPSRRTVPRPSLHLVQPVRRSDLLTRAIPDGLRWAG